MAAVLLLLTVLSMAGACGGAECAQNHPNVSACERDVCVGGARAICAPTLWRELHWALDYRDRRPHPPGSTARRLDRLSLGLRPSRSWRA